MHSTTTYCKYCFALSLTRFCCCKLIPSHDWLLSHYIFEEKNNFTKNYIKNCNFFSSVMHFGLQARCTYTIYIYINLYNQLHVLRIFDVAFEVVVFCFVSPNTTITKNTRCNFVSKYYYSKWRTIYLRS